MEATVLKRTDGVLGIVGQASDASVGGGVFTDRLVAFCAKDFKRRTGGLDIFESKRSVLKVCIYLACVREVRGTAVLGIGTHGFVGQQCFAVHPARWMVN